MRALLYVFKESLIKPFYFIPRPSGTSINFKKPRYFINFAVKHPQLPLAKNPIKIPSTPFVFQIHAGPGAADVSRRGGPPVRGRRGKHRLRQGPLQRNVEQAHEGAQRWRLQMRNFDRRARFQAEIENHERHSGR